MSNYRVKSIIAAYSAITGNQSIQSILGILKRSFTFNEVLKGDNYAVNYDSTLCNLLDIVDDLKQIDGCPDEVFLINHDALVRYFADVKERLEMCDSTCSPMDILNDLCVDGSKNPMTDEELAAFVSDVRKERNNNR